METLWMLVICSIVSYSLNLKVYMSNSYGSFVTLFKMLCCHVNFVFLFSLFISNSFVVVLSRNLSLVFGSEIPELANIHYIGH